MKTAKLIVLVIGMLLFSVVCAQAQTTLLENNGAATSVIGPNPSGDFTVSSNGYDGETCLLSEPIPDVAYGIISFPGTVLAPNQGSISFMYEPSQTAGNIIFDTGGDPSNGGDSSLFALYQNWYWGGGPMLAASVGSNSWGYLIQNNAGSNFVWNTNHWYQMTIDYQMTGSASDYIDWYIDGVQQTGYQQAVNTAINPLLSGANAQPLYFGGYSYYGIAENGFDNIVTTSGVPEPGSCVTLLAGLTGLCGLAFRKRR